MTVFFILKTKKKEFVIQDDVDGYEWVGLDEIPDDLGFPELREYLAEHLGKIKKAVE
jgi:hypothetical protein